MEAQGEKCLHDFDIPVCLWDNVQTETLKRKKKCVKAIKKRKHSFYTQLNPQC